MTLTGNFNRGKKVAESKKNHQERRIGKWEDCERNNNIVALTRKIKPEVGRGKINNEGKRRSFSEENNVAGGNP